MLIRAITKMAILTIKIRFGNTASNRNHFTPLASLRTTSLAGWTYLYIRLLVFHLVGYQIFNLVTKVEDKTRMTEILITKLSLASEQQGSIEKLMASVALNCIQILISYLSDRHFMIKPSQRRKIGFLAD